MWSSRLEQVSTVIPGKFSKESSWKFMSVAVARDTVYTINLRDPIVLTEVSNRTQCI